MHLGVIAAGDGLRLREEGIKEPKPLIKISGKTLLERILTISSKFGFETCNLIINEKFKNEIDDSLLLSNTGLRNLNYIFKSTPSSLHSLYELKKFLKDSFCLMTIDSIFLDSEFESFISTANEESDYDGFIAVTGFVDDEKPLWVKVNGNDTITGFGSLQEGSELVTGGIYFFKKGIINYTEKAISENKVRLRNFLQYLIEEGKKLKAVRFSKIIDVDHQKDIMEAEAFLKQNTGNK